MKMFLFFSLVFGSSIALARPYGEAGCGLGSIVFGSKPGFIQVVAATLNGTSANQTFGITSGTSNCSGGGSRRAQVVPQYIEVNKYALAKDAARGEGETLAGLASLIGCDSSKLGNALRMNYNDIFIDSKMDSLNIESGINNVIVKDKVSTCGA